MEEPRDQHERDYLELGGAKRMYYRPDSGCTARSPRHPLGLWVLESCKETAQRSEPSHSILVKQAAADDARVGVATAYDVRPVKCSL